MLNADIAVDAVRDADVDGKHGIEDGRQLMKHCVGELCQC